MTTVPNTAPTTTTTTTTAAAAAAGAEWWRHAVVYQIYVRSFADGNGDGTGDIAGMRARLPYLERLGIDAIWVNPWYHSPLHDGGYDVADYRRINESFGTTEEAEAFIAEARDHGIRVIVDLVPNHLSSDHEWFVEALASPPGSAARARFHFLPGAGVDGAEPPNDWRSVFGGPAWTRVTEADGSPGEWYLHLFDTTQPDVNWENPDVAEELEAVMRFWLDRGASGFRVDVAHSLVKAPGYPELGDRFRRDGADWVEGHPHWDRDEIHVINRRLRATLDEYPDAMMVAEAWVRADRRPLYLRPDEYHQAFDFDFLGAPWDAKEFRRMIGSSFDAARAVGSHPTWVLSNHDVVRHATRYGLPNGTDSGAWLLDGPHDLLDAEQGERRARAAALVTLGLPGSTYVYQGDELGLPEVWDLPTEVLDDPVWTDSKGTRKGRDGCRVPLPWSADGPSYGFGDGEPWMPQPALFEQLAASAQDGDPASTLELYREVIRVRRESLAGGDHLEFGDLGADVLDIDRGDVRIVINMGDEAVAMPPGEILVASDPTQAEHPAELAPDSGVWLAL